jgi:hypothetical protein
MNGYRPRWLVRDVSIRESVKIAIIELFLRTHRIVNNAIVGGRLPQLAYRTTSNRGLGDLDPIEKLWGIRRRRVDSRGRRRSCCGFSSRSGRVWKLWESAGTFSGGNHKIRTSPAGVCPVVHLESANKTIGSLSSHGRSCDSVSAGGQRRIYYRIRVKKFVNVQYWPE